MDVGPSSSDRHEPDSQAAVDAATFRSLGSYLIERLASSIENRSARPVAADRHAVHLIELLRGSALPESGMDARTVFGNSIDLLEQHATSTNHPRFWAYIMGSTLPVAALADLVVSTMSVPVTGYSTCPLSATVEAQTVGWIGEMLGYPAEAGLFLSGGSVANLVALRAALHARAGWDTRKLGVTPPAGGRLRVYATSEAHSSVASALSSCGLGTAALRCVATDSDSCMRVDALEELVRRDLREGLQPIAVVATAGTTSTGSVDPIAGIAKVAERYGLWFHLDAAYGGFAALVPAAELELGNMGLADSLTVDPHKWLYVGANVGCLLVKHKRTLFGAFHEESPYYAHAENSELLGGPEVLQFRDLGPETTRSFRALKVRLCLETLGISGYRRLIAKDLELARHLYEEARQTRDLEVGTCRLSIATLRYLPSHLRQQGRAGEELASELNRRILQELRARSVAFPSQLTRKGEVWLRFCFVNSNTIRQEVGSLPLQIVAIGREIEDSLRRLRSVDLARAAVTRG